MTSTTLTWHQIKEGLHLRGILTETGKVYNPVWNLLPPFFPEDPREKAQHTVDERNDDEDGEHSLPHERQCLSECIEHGTLPLHQHKRNECKHNPARDH